MGSKALDHRFKEITSTYHTFVKDQVLTETQLNEFLRYFDDNDGLSRFALSGVGIVCGLKPKLTTVPDAKMQIQKQLEITKGFGVTTDGDLLYLGKTGSKELLKDINLSKLVFTNYRKFEDTTAEYIPFKNNVSSFVMWEALQSHEVSNLAEEPLLTNLPDIDNMVALLYLEWYEDDANLCDELSCDSQGTLQGARLRVLLLSQANAAVLTSNDKLFTKHDLMAVYQQMKDISVPRVIVGNVLTGEGNTATASQLTSAYKLADFGDTIAALKDGMTVILDKLKLSYPDNPITGIANNEMSLTESTHPIISAMNTLLPPTEDVQELFFQYRYDLLKDLVDTYNELKEAFIRISTECFPDITAFPKHLLLGKLNATEEDELISNYRHKFYRSPILAEAPSYQIFISLLSRFNELLNSYPQLTGKKKVHPLLRTDVKITPSNFRSPLGVKAIPFYYDLTNELLKVWHYEKTAVGKFKRNLSYNTDLLEQVPEVLTPLRFNQEPYPFYRIEGHQGRDYREALTKIDAIKKENGLSFDVKALCVDVDTNYVISPADYECEFEDLSVLLKAWVDEQQCGIAKATSLISAYSLAVPEYNVLEEYYMGPIGVVYPAPKFRDDLLINYSDKEKAVAEKVAALEGTVEPSNKVKELSEESAVIQKAKEQAAGKNKIYYDGKATVIDNLTAKEDTLGGAFLYAMQNQPNGKPNDLALAANYYADRFIEEHKIVWDKRTKDILVNNSFHLLAYLQALSNSIPVSVAKIDDAVISRYNTNIENLCSTLQKVQVTYTDSEKLTPKNRAILGLLVNQLTTLCCASKQLQALLVEIDGRKDAILERLTLKKFVEQHPGLEHLAGVESGGTFVLVYLRKGTNVVGGVQNAPNGTVIADFSLPYMCCADCSPINFIVPKAPVALSLPKDVVCLGKDLEVMTFNVEPVDGVIKADQEINGMSILDDVLTINPLTFDKTKLNQVIKFTVNDQITNCQLVVKEPLLADFNVPESPANNTLVSFSALGTFPPGTKFEWRFGDGNVSTMQSVAHNYVLPLASGTNTVEVTLTVIPADGACPTVIRKSFTFEQVRVDIVPKVFCNNDKEIYNFVVIPTGATPTITGTGVNTTNRTFSPLNLAPGNVPVLLNGSPVLSLQITAPPTIVMDGKIVGEVLELSSNVDKEMSYKWTFWDATGKVEVHPPITDKVSPDILLSAFKQVKEGDVFTVILEVESPCGTVRREKSFLMPITKVTISLPKTTFCNNDAKVYTFQVTPDGAPANIDGPGVDSVNRTFKAYQLPVGTAVINLNGKPELNLTITALPQGVSFDMDIRDANLLLDGTIPPGHNFYWTFAKNDGTKVHDDLYNTASALLPLSEFTEIKSGELLLVKLIVESPCGEVTSMKEIIYREAPRKNACELDASDDLSSIKVAVASAMKGSVYKDLNTGQKEFFVKLNTFLEEVINDPTPYMNGSKNQQVFEELAVQLNILKETVFAAANNREVMQLLYDLYKMYVSLLYSILQCQDEEILSKDETLNPLLQAINSNFDTQNSNSFWLLKPNIDQGGVFRIYLEGVKSYRPEGGMTYTLISQLIDFVL